MAKTETKNNKREALITALFSTDAKKVLEALHKMPEQGDPTMVIPLLKTRQTWEDQTEIQGRIEKILKELKTESAIPELIRALEDPAFDRERAFIISLFWNAGLFPTEDFEILVKHAIRGDYMVAFEALTVIEHAEAGADPDLLQQLMLDIDEYLDRNPTAGHAQVLLQLKDVLKDQYNL